MSNRIFCHPALRTILFILLSFAGAGAMRAATKDPWNSVSPEDLAAKDSKINPGADAEILLSFSDFQYRGGLTSIDRATVTKIYTQKGVEDRGKLDLELAPWEELSNLKARVLKPDGRIIDLKKEDFLESVQIKYEDQKWKKVAFAFPDLTAGDVVVTSWTVEMGTYYYTRYFTFCQELLPVRQYQFKISSFRTDYDVEWANCKAELKSSKGTSSMSLTTQDLPAFEKEDFMPPEREFRGSVSIVGKGFWEGDDAWKNLSAEIASDFSDQTKPGSWKAKAAELTAGATSEEEKLRRLYDFCQREIVNYTWADTAEAKAARDKHLENDDTRSGAATLKKKQGTDYEINLAFAALARAAGFEVKETRSASRIDIFNIKTPTGWAHLNISHVAVKLDGKWRILNPGNYWTPFGMLNWSDEMVTVLLCDKTNVIYETTPVAAANLSPVNRKGRFSLDEEGTLLGEVEESYGGHAGMKLKSDNWQRSDADTNKDLVKEIVERLPTAEITGIRWENLRTRDYPVTLHYKVRVPGYAESAGSRLTFVSNYFESGRRAIFTAPARKFPIFFSYAYQHHDDIEITLPENFQLDHPSAPANVGEMNSALGAEYKLAYFQKKRLLHYSRTFELAGNGIIAFQAQSYPVFQKLFSQLHRSDSHSLIIRPVDVVVPVLPPETHKLEVPAPAKTGAP
jgi:Domain of Unknown Function with PDB structure (DUF3857)/Transglutaminase-like superfamily